MIRCPHCGNDAEFAFDAADAVTAYVTQIVTKTVWAAAGTLDITDLTRKSWIPWDAHTPCRCCVCGWAAPLETFAVSDYLYCIDSSET